MKTEIKELKKKKFIKFELKIIVESEEEARLLFHVFNHAQLKEAIKNSEGYDGEDYNWNSTAKYLSGDNVCRYINEVVNLYEE